MTEHKVGTDRFAANPGNRGKGRPKGAVNKTTRVFKEAIEAAADAAHPEGVVGYLTQQAQENPVAFMSLIGKVLPVQLNHAGGITVTTTQEQRDAAVRAALLADK